MPDVEVQSSRRVVDDHGEGATMVEYALPEVGLRRDEMDPGGRGRYGGHFHHIPDSAVVVRSVVYGITVEQALEECILERVDKDNRRSGRLATATERQASRGRFPLRGPGLTRAHADLPASVRSAEARDNAEERVARGFGARMDELRAVNPALAERVIARHEARRTRVQPTGGAGEVVVSRP